MFMSKMGGRWAC